MKFVTKAFTTVFGFYLLASCLADNSTTQSNGPNCYQNPHADGTCPFEDITFWLYTKAYPNGIQISDINDLKNLHVHHLDSWKIIFHGLLDSKDGSPVQIVKAYLSDPVSTNILVLNYPKIVETYKSVQDAYKCYLHIIQEGISLVGRCTVQRLAEFIRAGVMPKPNHLHIIGHSMGTATGANVCVRLNELGLGKVKRFTGLDPVGACYSRKYSNPREIINPNDAKFVDVYHTNAGPMFNNADDESSLIKVVDGKLVCDTSAYISNITLAKYFGSSERSGTVDVIFNGGSNQPGCPPSPPLCHHRRSVEFFAESINPKPHDPLFIGRTGRYNDIPVLVGEHISTALKGDIFINTNAESPYAKGLYM